MRVALVAILLAVETALIWIAVTTLPFFAFNTSAGYDLLYLSIGEWVAFALAVILLRLVPTKAVSIVIIAGSFAISGAALAGPPNTSTDSARYAWDGIVQDAGISPYAHPAISSATERLRPEWLFPTPHYSANGKASCPQPRTNKYIEPGTSVVVCTTMNRGHARTIYPPATELLFAGIRLLVGPEAQYWPMQVVGALLVLATTLLLLRGLRARGRDPRWAALWAWCPLVASEAVTNSHVDVFGAFLLLLGALLVSSGRPWRGGLAIGAAISAKLVPVIGAPALLGRRPWKLIAASVGIFALLYVPYVMASGVKVLGFLPKYLVEEGYNNGSRFALIYWFIRWPGSSPVQIGLAVLIFAVTVLLVWAKSDPANPWLGEVVMIGVTLILISPRYGWYALMLVPMVAMTGRWEWMSVTLALALRIIVPRVTVYRVDLAVCVAIIIAVSLWRAGPDGRRRAIDEVRHPFRRPTSESRKVSPSLEP